MTISSTVRVAGPFVGNGTASVFPFAFKVFAATDLDVIRLASSTGVESTLVLNSDYSVTLNGDQNSNPGGSVTLLAGALASGFTLTITSDIANLQPTDLTNQGGFYPEVITDSLDRATIQIQQISDIGDRTLKIPISDGTGIDMELPPAAARANSFLSFDANGEPTVVAAGSSGAPTTITRQVFSGTGSQTAFTLASDPGALGNSAQVYIGGVYQQRSTYTIAGTTLTFSSAPVAGTDNIEFVNFLTSSIGATSADLVVYTPPTGPAVSAATKLTALSNATGITYTPAGSGAVARSAASKFGDVVSVKDFGAVGDGVADDTAAIQAAVTYVNGLGGGTVYLPQGNYIITAPISIYSNIRFIGAGGESTKITKTTNTPVAASETASLVCLFLQSMGDVNGDVNCILWVTASIRAEKVEIAHMTLRSNAASPIGSPVRFGIATVGMSDSHIHDLQIEYVSLAAFVAPVFWFSKIELVQVWKCVQGVAIENVTTCSINNNYVVGARDAGYYLRNLKYSTVEANACDNTNSASSVPAYSDRSIRGISYVLDACTSVSFKNNGSEQCFGTIWLFKSCQNIDASNNLCIGPQSDYTGAGQIALFHVDTYARNVSLRNNFVFRNNVTALQGAAVAAQHHDVYVDVVSTNRGFEFANNVFCNTQFDNPSTIYGNVTPTYITTGIQGAQLSGEFTPSMSLDNATGVSITYGANNKGRYSIVNGWMYVEAYVHIASVTFSGTTNIYPKIGGLPLENNSAQQCDLLITQSSNVTWPSTEPFYFAIDTSQPTGLARNRTRTVTLGTGGTPSFSTGSTDVVFKCCGSVYVGDSVNIV